MHFPFITLTMKHLCLFYLTFCVGLVGVFVGVLGNTVENDDELKPKCNHSHHQMDNLSNNQTLKDIDKLLDEIYDSLVTNGAYEVDCTYSVTGYPTNESESMELTLLLEGLEVRRSRYEQGLWGYCAKEGAEELMRDMNMFKNMSMTSKENNSTYVICDRDEFLYCHPKYRKCQCLVDNKNFRNQVAEWWDDDQEKSKIGGKGFCGLIIGSDCPFGKEPKFQCLPGLTCRLKSNKTIICSAPETGASGGRMTEKAHAVNKNGTTVEDKKKRYRFTRNDMGSVNCQCYGYTGGSSPIGAILYFSEYYNEKAGFKKIFRLCVLFSFFYMFNKLFT